MKKLEECNKELEKPKARLIISSITTTLLGLSWLGYIWLLWEVLSGAKYFITDNYPLYILLIVTLVLIYLSFNVIPTWFFEEIDNIKERYKQIK